MKKLGKTFAMLFVLGLTIVSCSKDDDYTDYDAMPVQPLAPGVEHPIVLPPTVAPAQQ